MAIGKTRVQAGRQYATSRGALMGGYFRDLLGLTDPEEPQPFFAGQFGIRDPEADRANPQPLFASLAGLQPVPPLEPADPQVAQATTASDDDVRLLGRLIFAEGADHWDKPGAMEGIGWTVRNRMGAPGFPKTLDGVVFQPRQFQGVGNRQWNNAADPSALTGTDALAYQHAQDVARGILNGDISDKTGGATYFFTSPDGAPPNDFFTKKLESGRLERSGNSIGKFTFVREPQSRR